ncbi:MAG: ABC transporter ATP-binding protein [Candidatus Acidiferrales bacterium]
MIHKAELKRLLGYVRPYSLLLVFGTMLMAVVGLMEGLMGLLITPLFDVVLNPSSIVKQVGLVKLPNGHEIYLNPFFPERIHYVWTVFALSLLAVVLVKAISEYLGNISIQYVGLSGITDLRNEVYGKVLRQPIGFFQHHPTGRLMSVVINDVEKVRSALSEFLADLFRQIFSLIAFSAVLLIINWKLALGSAIFLPLVIYPVGKLGRRIRQSSEKTQSRLAELSQLIQETVSGNRVVKAFGMEHFEIGRFREAARRLLRETMRWVKAYVVTGPLMDILAAVVIAMLMLFVRDQIKHGLMTLGVVMTFFYCMFKVYEPIKRLGGIYQLFEQAVGASTQVFTFLALGEEEPDDPRATALPRFSREVHFDEVSFAYDSGPAILKGIRLNVSAGTVVAIVGSSGAGKTTLVNLLPRFYAATAGVVHVDGHDVRKVTLRSLREQMAIVTQETILFNDTVWNNLCYGRPDLPKDRVVEAARAALAHDFIEELPQGYQTQIGDRGQRLSGGQRQRLAIARALLKDAPILILDEATSELDSESEMLVQRALNNLMTGRTVFVIAHRLSTIRRAHMIAVIEGGTIAELGTHEELLARGGVYTRLYEMQFHDTEYESRDARQVQ